jgi:hypothetical protein
MSIQNLIGNPIFEFIIFGDEKSGKSTFLQKDKNNLQYTNNTLKRNLTFICEDKKITINCIDKHGQSDPKLSNFLYDGAVILLDLSKSIKQAEIIDWISYIFSTRYNARIFVIGNKKDLVQDEIDDVKELKKRLQKMDIDYLETTSLQLNLNIYSKIIQKMLRLNQIPQLN